MSRAQPPTLSREEMTRYSRQMVMPEVGPEGQKKLKSASVLVVGAGGLGVPAAVHLATAGVGRIGIVDDDAVELQNLHRQFLYSSEDVGTNKVEVARDKLTRMNANVQVTPFKLKLDSTNALKVLADFDIIVDATDNFPSRYLINDACVMLGKPDVYASALRLEGQASVFFPPDGPCYRCLYPVPPPSDTVQSCDVAGVLGVVTGVLGGLQANQAINLILGGQTLVGRLLVFDGRDTSFTELKIRRNPNCPVCSKSRDKIQLIDYEDFCGVRKAPASSSDEVDVLQLKSELDAGSKLLLLDVREPFEYQLCHLGNSKLVPLGQLPDQMNELDKGTDMVVYCHTGVRSARAVAYLKSKGFKKVRNLKGGIQAWSDLVDPSVPDY
ncbi:MAG TPA: molybdopterin-synthase adenylyltransferase MoeB [Nitrososphaerales archaeon]|nr:molybdopterin-synthase adenylyltransferase MoeB [Nitrososphaerales archaeon]